MAKLEPLERFNRLQFHIRQLRSELYMSLINLVVDLLQDSSLGTIATIDLYFGDSLA